MEPVPIEVHVKLPRRHSITQIYIQNSPLWPGLRALSRRASHAVSLTTTNYSNYYRCLSLRTFRIRALVLYMICDGDSEMVELQPRPAEYANFQMKFMKTGAG